MNGRITDASPSPTRCRIASIPDCRSSFHFLLHSPPVLTGQSAFYVFFIPSELPAGSCRAMNPACRPWICSDSLLTCASGAGNAHARHLPAHEVLRSLARTAPLSPPPPLFTRIPLPTELNEPTHPRGTGFPYGALLRCFDGVRNRKIK